MAPLAPREVDIFRKYSKNNKVITMIIAIAVAVAFVVGMYFFIKAVIPYTVKFETDGGTVVPDAKYKFLQPVEEPERVKKEGYYIEKWSTKKDLSDRFEFGTKLWRSMTLYVDWEPGFAIVLNFASGEENKDLSTADLKLLYEQYIKPGTDWTLPAVYNLNEDSLNYGERLVWFDNPECTGTPFMDKTYTNLTENINIYGKWFDVDEDKFKVDENGTLQTYLGYAKNIMLPSNIKAIKDIEPTKFIPGTDQLNEQFAQNASVFRNVINSIESIYLNEELQNIGSCAFRSCMFLKRIEFLGDNVTRIGKHVFRDTQITAIDLPNKLTTIEEYCFYNATQLASITLGDKVAVIENNAFENCYNLKTVELHSAPRIENLAFSSCAGLKKFTIYAEALAHISLGLDEATLRQECIDRDSTMSEEEIAKYIDKTFREANIFYATAGTSAMVNYLKIYVPESLLASYKDAYGWNLYADYIYKIKS